MLSLIPISFILNGNEYSKRDSGHLLQLDGRNAARKEEQYTNRNNYALKQQ